MLWVLKRDGLFEHHSKHMFKLMGKLIITILCSKFCYSSHGHFLTSSTFAVSRPMQFGSAVFAPNHTAVAILIPGITISYYFHLIRTVELWSLELACLEHQESLELIRRSQQFPYTFNVKIHHRLEQRWLKLSNSKHCPQGDFSCTNAMMARTKYYFT